VVVVAVVVCLSTVVTVPWNETIHVSHESPHYVWSTYLLIIPLSLGTYYLLVTTKSMAANTLVFTELSRRDLSLELEVKFILVSTTVYQELSRYILTISSISSKVRPLPSGRKKKTHMAQTMHDGNQMNP
jgi:hypothetical protein